MSSPRLAHRRHFSLLAREQWTLGAAVYSFGISVKMNLLLFLPGVLFLLVRNTGIARTLGCMLLVLLIQVCGTHGSRTLLLGSSSAAPHACSTQ